MTITSENTSPSNLSQDKIDPTLSQQSLDPKVEQEVKSEEKAEDPNWRAFREARKQDRIQREAAEKKALEKEAEVAALKAAMEAAFAKGTPQQRSNDGYSAYAEDETEDERIEKKVQQAIAAREAANERSRHEREVAEYPKRLAREYSDFNSTISDQNLDYLEYHYPEVVAPLKRLPDNYDKWADIYRAVKKFVPNSSTAMRDAARAEANFAKPKSMSSTSITQSSPVDSSSRLSEEKKAENWARMKKMLSGLS